MGNTRIIELMAKKAGRFASPEELEELTALLGSNPDHAYFHEIVHALKGNQDHLEQITPKEEVVNHGWQELSDKLSRQQEQYGLLRSIGGRMLNGRFRRIGAAAAVILLLAGIGGAAYFTMASRKINIAPIIAEPSPLTARAGYGATQKLVLSDGTKVRLNAGSKLIYPAVFSGKTREVDLDGEAFFEVAKDKKAPFSVHAGKITVGVLGTSFNLKAYNEDSEIEATLISGKVQVTLDNEPEKSILLSPLEKLTIVNATGQARSPNASNKQGGRTSSSNVLRYKVQTLPAGSGNSFVETAWLDNKLLINNESFEIVAHSLERKYGVDIRFEDETLMQEHISGVFEKESISEVLQILKMTTGFNYRMEGNVIHLYRK